MSFRPTSVFSVFTLVLLAGCGGGATSNRTPVDVRGDAITPVDRRAPEGTLTEVAAPPAPVRVVLPKREPDPAISDTPRVVHRAEPPAPAPTANAPTTTTPGGTSTAPPSTPPSAKPSGSTPSAPKDDYLVKPVPPEPITRVAPVYPERARAARVGGVVLVRALVDTEGRVRATRIARSIPELDSAAVQCVRQWRFKPGTSGGVVIATWAEVPVRFLLQ